MSALCAVLSTRIQRVQKIWEYIPCTDCTGQENDFELIPMVKKKFGSEFLAICNHCGVLAAWSRKTLKFCEKFLRFLEKRPLMVKFSKFCSKSFHRLTGRRCCVQISWNLADRKSAKSRITYRTKNKQNFAWLSSCRYCADRAQNLPEPVHDNILRVLHISFKSVHFRWSYSRTREHRQNAL